MQNYKFCTLHLSVLLQRKKFVHCTCRTYCSGKILYNALVRPTAAEKFCTMHLSILVQRKKSLPCSSKILLYGTKFFSCTSFFFATLTGSHYISRMQRIKHLLRRSRPDHEGTKGPLAGNTRFLVVFPCAAWQF